MKENCIGAWGLRLSGTGRVATLLADARPWLYPTPLDCAGLTIRFEDYKGFQPDVELSEEHALLTFEAGGYAVVRREDFSATYHLPKSITAEALVHPYLAGPVSIANHWLGRQVLHAGAVLYEGRVTALVGNRQAGKSTLLAMLAGAGKAIVTDDLLVLSDGWAFPGPRFVDLRVGAAVRLSQGRDLGILGNRERHRVHTTIAAPPDGARLNRIVFLEWGGDVAELVPVPASERVPRLLNQVAIQAQVALPDPLAMLNLASVPTLVLRRPQNWDVAEHVITMLAAGVVDN
jgi:energy-coupling factor transporter ATP-binding protein EcfA2